MQIRISERIIKTLSTSKTAKINLWNIYPCAMNIIRLDPLHRNDPFEISFKLNTNNKHIGCAKNITRVDPLHCNVPFGES